MRKRKTKLDRATIQKIAASWLGVKKDTSRKWFAKGRRIPPALEKAIEEHAKRMSR